MPRIGRYFEYTAAPGERTVGEHGERCEHFYGNKDLLEDGDRSVYAFAVYLPSDFRYLDAKSDWFYVSQAHKNCPCGGFGGPNVGIAVNSEGNFKVKVRALSSLQVYDKALGPATRGRRHTFLVDAYWSQKDDGHLVVEWNGDKVVDYRGPTLFNDNSGGVKLQGGIYRRSTSYAQTVYLVPNHYGSVANVREWLTSLPACPTC